MSKNIEYFSKFKNVQVYICDSSPNAYDGVFPSNITYLHLPQDKFVSKMKRVVKIIKTPYVCVCADDDYVIEKSIVYMIQRMQTDNYVMSVGRYAGFDVPFNGLYEIYPTLPLINNLTSTTRVNSYMFRYYMALWAVYDVQTLLKAYTVLNQASYRNHNLIELTIAIVCASEGKILFYDDLYAIREGNNQFSKNWAKGHKSLLSEYIYNNKEFMRQINSLEIAYNDIYQAPLFRKGLYRYLIGSIYSVWGIRIKRVLKLLILKNPLEHDNYIALEKMIKRHLIK